MSLLLTSIKRVAIKKCATAAEIPPSRMNKTTGYIYIFCGRILRSLECSRNVFRCVPTDSREPRGSRLRFTAKIYESQTVRAAADDGAFLIARGKNVVYSQDPLPCKYCIELPLSRNFMASHMHYANLILIRDVAFLQ